MKNSRCWTFLLPLMMLLTACEQPKPEAKKELIRPVRAVQVADPNSLAERSFPGRARAGQEVNLSFRVSGPLILLPVNVGDEINKGDVLAQIDPNDFKVRVQTVTGELERARAALKLSQREYQRGLDVSKKGRGLISESELDKRLGARDQAQAAVKALEAALQAANDDLAYSQLKAPFDGVVVSTYVKNFETVIAKQPILRLLDPARIEFIIDVPERLIGYAPYVEEILVRFDAVSESTIVAEIKEIGKEASQVTRTYPVTLVMEQPEDVEILPGMAGQASIVSRLPTDNERVGIELPAVAVFTAGDAGQSFVWIVDEGSKKVSRREIRLGQLTDYGVLATEGINPGEWVVVAGVHSLKDGQEVTIQDVAAAEGS